jgi:hypothetical protein
MAAIFWWWGGSALVISGLALLIGFVATQRVLGFLIDSRGRYSLTHLQVSLWTIVILSLIAGVFFGRWQHNVAHPLAFTIPSVVLGLLGISIGTGVTATAGKIAKNTTRPANVAASARILALIGEDPDPAAEDAEEDEDGSPKLAHPGPLMWRSEHQGPVSSHCPPKSSRTQAWVTRVM